MTVDTSGGNTADLFHRALELVGEDREEFLHRVCASNPDLLEELVSLLSAHVRVEESFLEPPGEPDLVGTRIGPFDLVSLLGRGGMGAVFEARQERPKRTVALKVLRVLPGSGGDLRRFEREAEMMAGLSHPNVASVFDVGVDAQPAGRFLWISMELVSDALPLIQYADEARLSLRDRLRLFETLCGAVQYGHERGVLHRDLKPDNILVDGEGRLRVIDFGVARAVGPAATGEKLTYQGDLIGTLPYMSAELRAGADAGSRTEVFALGVILYELVLGRSPFPVQGKSVMETLEILEKHRPERPRRLRPGISPDLETVILTAMGSQASERYSTVEALAEDLRRVRRNRPILAETPGLLRQLRLFVRRHRLLCVSVGVVFASLSWATLASTLAANRADRAARQARHEAYLGRIAAAASALRNFEAGAVRFNLDRAPEELRGWEWWHLKGRVDESRTELPWPGIFVIAGSFASEVPLVAGAASGPEVLRVWDLETNEVLTTLPRDRGLVTSCALSPDGRYLGAGYATGRVELLDLPGGQIRRTWKAFRGKEVRSLLFHPSGDSIVAGSLVGDMLRLDLSADGDGERMPSLGAAVHAFAFNAEGDALFVGCGAEDPRIFRLDWKSGETTAIGAGHDSNVESLAVQPSGKLLASCSMDGTVRLWNARELEPVATLRGHSKGVKSVAFSLDGESLASGGLDNTVRCWRSSDGRELAVFVGHSDDVQEVGFTGEAGELASLSRSGVRTWGSSLRDYGELEGLDQGVADLRLVERASGDHVVAVSVTGQTIVWEERTGSVCSRGGLTGDVRGHAFLDAGARSLYFLDPEGVLTVEAVEDPSSRREIRRFRSSPEIMRADRDGTRFAFSRRDWVGVLDPSTDAYWTWPTSGANVAALALHPTRRLVAWSSVRGELTISSLDGETIYSRTWDSHWELRLIEFSADGSRLAVAFLDGTVLVLSLEDLTVIHTLPTQAEQVRDLAFSPDGSRLASASLDGTVRIWDMEWGSEVVVLRGHNMHALRIRWSDRGDRLLSGGGDWFPESSLVRVWGGR